MLVRRGNKLCAYRARSSSEKKYQSALLGGMSPAVRASGAGMAYRTLRDHQYQPSAAQVVTAMAFAARRQQQWHGPAAVAERRRS